MRRRVAKRVHKRAKLFNGIKQLLTLSGVAEKSGRQPKIEDLGIMADAAVITSDNGKIIWVGPRRKIRAALRDAGLALADVHEIDLKVETVMPAFVDCHTHLVFAGDRSHEFELRNKGATYQDIAKQGGGIQYTVKQTRAASSAQLLKLAQARLAREVSQGVATVEIKSGYGLSDADELKILEVIKNLKSKTAARVVATYLGPHAAPAGRSREEYLREVIESTLPKVKTGALADRVDIFVEENYFTVSEERRYFAKARELGLALTVHAEQLTRTGAGRVAAEMGAQSIDHCVQMTEADVQEMATKQSVCVLLPASDFYLKMKYPPARALIDSGARVALATDYNPGTSPTLDLSLVGVLARLEMRMTQAEVVAGLTYNAAQALGLGQEAGVLQPGFSADFICIDDEWQRLFYEVGYHPVRQTYCRGKNVSQTIDLASKTPKT